MTADLPPDAVGLIVGYSAGRQWHESNRIPKDLAEDVMLRIGNGAVAFMARVVARAGSVTCEAAPATEFSEPAPVDVLQEAGAIEPSWPS